MISTMTTNRPALKPIAGLSMTLAILLSVAILIGFVTIALMLSARSYFSSILNGAQATETANQGIINQGNTADGLATAITVLIAIPFLIWVYRAYHNLTVFGARDLLTTPGAAVGFFFIPIANLVLVIMAMTDVWKGSDPRVNPANGPAWKSAPGTPLIALWWILFWVKVCVTSLTTAVISASDAGLQSVLIAYDALIFGVICFIVSAVFMIRMILTVNERQLFKMAQLGLDG